MPTVAETLVYRLTDGRVAGVLVLVLLGFLAGRRHFRVAAELGVAAGLASLAVVALKAASDVPRPLGSTFSAWGSAFPSGHAAIAAAVGVVLYGVAQARLCGRGARWLVDALILLAVLGVAASRVWLGLHYVPDVLAGVTLGGLAGLGGLALGRFLARRSSLFRRRAKVC